MTKFTLQLDDAEMELLRICVRGRIASLRTLINGKTKRDGVGNQKMLDEAKALLVKVGGKE